MTKALNKDTFMKLWKEELQPTILDRIRDEIKPIRDNIQAVKVKCDQIESSQAFLAEKYDSMLELLQSTKKQVSELDQSLKQEEKKIDELEKVLEEKDVKLDEMINILGEIV
jgi:chromosome segregation ATPase